VNSEHDILQTNRGNFTRFTS